MKRLSGIILALALLVPMAATAAKSLPALAAKNPDKKLAIVSVSANNFRNSLQGWNSARTSDLMGSRLNKMLEIAENLLANDWTIVNANTFVKNAEYQKLAGAVMAVGLPVIDGSPMPLMAENREELIRTRMSEAKARALAAVTGADFLMIIYSEWGVKTGLIRTSKALAKNVVGVYDAAGKQVYFGRSDKLGNKILGAMGRVAVDDNSIDQWVNAFEAGITALSLGKK